MPILVNRMIEAGAAPPIIWVYCPHQSDATWEHPGLWRRDTNFWGTYVLAILRPRRSACYDYPCELLEMTIQILEATLPIVSTYWNVFTTERSSSSLYRHLRGIPRYSRALHPITNSPWLVGRIGILICLYGMAMYVLIVRGEYNSRIVHVIVASGMFCFALVVS